MGSLDSQLPNFQLGGGRPGEGGRAWGSESTFYGEHNVQCSMFNTSHTCSYFTQKCFLLIDHTESLGEGKNIL